MRLGRVLSAVEITLGRDDEPPDPGRPEAVRLAAQPVRLRRPRRQDCQAPPRAPDSGGRRPAAARDARSSVSYTTSTGHGHRSSSSLPTSGLVSEVARTACGASSPLAGDATARLSSPGQRPKTSRGPRWSGCCGRFRATVPGTTAESCARGSSEDLTGPAQVVATPRGPPKVLLWARRDLTPEGSRSARGSPLQAESLTRPCSSPAERSRRSWRMVSFVGHVADRLEAGRPHQVESVHGHLRRPGCDRHDLDAQPAQALRRTGEQAGGDLRTRRSRPSGGRARS